MTSNILVQMNHIYFIHKVYMIFLGDYVDSYIYNDEIMQYDKDYKRFLYVINSVMYINEIKDKIGETEGIYEEATDPDKKELSQEEQEKNMIFDYLIKLIQTKNIEIGNWEKHKIPKNNKLAELKFNPVFIFYFRYHELYSYRC